VYEHHFWLRLVMFRISMCEFCHFDAL
jgi:hypothetical protein